MVAPGYGYGIVAMAAFGYGEPQSTHQPSNWAVSAAHCWLRAT